MGILKNSRDARRIALAAHCLIGRSATCTLRIREPLVSGEHARIAWLNGAWSVRDLGSSNGTWVDGERLDPGTARVLAAGAIVAFGAEQAQWILEDASPPVAMARQLSSGAMMAAIGGMLALPSERAPSICLIEHEGGWALEIDGALQQAQDGEVIQAGGEAFMLHLPVETSATLKTQPPQPKLDDASVHIRVSRDEERVEVMARWPGGTSVLPPRAHHYTLLTLARARLREQQDAELEEAQHGWVAVDELCSALAMEEERLNVEIYRIRRDFTATGLQGATGVIERRRGSRQLRLGVARVSLSGMS